MKEKPSLERNPVVASAMQIAKDRLRLHVASAPAPATPEPDAPPASDDEPATSDGPQPDTNEQLR